MPIDLITTAVISAVAKLGEPLVKDTYEGLKSLLVKKLGHAAAVPVAITAVEEKPESKARYAVLQEEIAASRADHDEELIQAARQLIQQVEAVPGGKEAVRLIVKGNHNIVAGGNISIGGSYTSGPGEKM